MCCSWYHHNGCPALLSDYQQSEVMKSLCVDGGRALGFKKQLRGTCICGTSQGECHRPVGVWCSSFTSATPAVAPQQCNAQNKQKQTRRSGMQGLRAALVLWLVPSALLWGDSEALSQRQRVQPRGAILKAVCSSEGGWRGRSDTQALEAPGAEGLRHHSTSTARGTWRGCWFVDSAKHRHACLLVAVSVGNRRLGRCSGRPARSPQAAICQRLAPDDKGSQRGANAPLVC